MTEYCYFTFPTTYFAIRAEAVLRKEQRAVKMVPVPRSISSSCGIALRCSCTETEEIRTALENYQVEYEGLHRVQEKEAALPWWIRRNKGEG